MFSDAGASTGSTGGALKGPWKKKADGMYTWMGEVEQKHGNPAMVSKRLCIITDAAVVIVAKDETIARHVPLDSIARLVKYEDSWYVLKQRDGDVAIRTADERFETCFNKRFRHSSLQPRERRMRLPRFPLAALQDTPELTACVEPFYAEGRIPEILWVGWVWRRERLYSESHTKRLLILTASALYLGRETDGAVTRCVSLEKVTRVSAHGHEVLLKVPLEYDAVLREPTGCLLHTLDQLFSPVFHTDPAEPNALAGHTIAEPPGFRAPPPLPIHAEDRTATTAVFAPVTTPSPPQAATAQPEVPTHPRCVSVESNVSGGGNNNSGGGGGGGGELGKKRQRRDSISPVSDGEKGGTRSNTLRSLSSNPASGGGGGGSSSTKVSSLRLPLGSFATAGSFTAPTLPSHRSNRTRASTITSAAGTMFDVSLPMISNQDSDTLHWASEVHGYFSRADARVGGDGGGGQSAEGFEPSSDEEGPVTGSFSALPSAETPTGLRERGRSAPVYIMYLTESKVKLTMKKYDIEVVSKCFDLSFGGGKRAGGGSGSGNPRGASVVSFDRPEDGDADVASVSSLGSSTLPAKEDLARIELTRWSPTRCEVRLAMRDGTTNTESGCDNSGGVPTFSTVDLFVFTPTAPGKRAKKQKIDDFIRSFQQLRRASGDASSACGDAGCALDDAGAPAGGCVGAAAGASAGACSGYAGKSEDNLSEEASAGACGGEHNDVWDDTLRSMVSGVSGVRSLVTSEAPVAESPDALASTTNSRVAARFALNESAQRLSRALDVASSPPRRSPRRSPTALAATTTTRSCASERSLGDEDMKRGTIRGSDGSISTTLHVSPGRAVSDPSLMQEKKLSQMSAPTIRHNGSFTYKTVGSSLSSSSRHPSVDSSDGEEEVVRVQHVSSMESATNSVAAVASGTLREEPLANTTDSLGLSSPAQSMNQDGFTPSPLKAFAKGPTPGALVEPVPVLPGAANAVQFDSRSGLPFLPLGWLGTGGLWRELRALYAGGEQPQLLYACIVHRVAKGGLSRSPRALLVTPAAIYVLAAEASIVRCIPLADVARAAVSVPTPLPAAAVPTTPRGDILSPASGSIPSSSVFSPVAASSMASSQSQSHSHSHSFCDEQQLRQLDTAATATLVVPSQYDLMCQFGCLESMRTFVSVLSAAHRAVTGMGKSVVRRISHNTSSTGKVLPVQQHDHPVPSAFSLSHPSGWYARLATARTRTHTHTHTFSGSRPHRFPSVSASTRRLTCVPSFRSARFSVVSNSLGPAS